MMKSVFLFIPCLLFQQILFSQRAIDVTNYEFDLELSDRSDSIYGKATITFESLKDNAPVIFELRQSSGKIGFTVSSVTAANKQLKFRQANDKLVITPLSPMKKAGTATISISYSGVPADGLIISKNKFGKRTFFSDNWPNRAHEWIPCIDEPADKATVEFMVTAPDHYQVISNGRMLYRKPLPGGRILTHYQEKIPLPTKIMVIGVAEFATEQSGMAGNIPVSTWVFPENKDAGFRDFAVAPQILTWMQDYIGPFPYEKLANVQSKTIFGGMENAGAIFFNEDLVDGKQDDEKIIAHEIAHQFFGDMVTEKNFSHVWLSEGFASYMAQLYLESRYGPEMFKKFMSVDRDAITTFSRTHRLPVIDSVTQMMELLNINSYQKGSWVLHMLRRQLGDSVFHSGMREYYRSFAGKNADSRDLQLVFEKVSHTPLDTFFHQWLEVPGQPELAVTWQNADNGQFEIRVKQQQQVPFSFPLVMRVVTSDGKQQNVTLQVNKAEQSFYFPIRQVQTVFADPDVSLLAHIAVKQLGK